jgi:hypothetical protein
MIDLLNDIESLENALILITEGASDEKRSGYAIIERMIEDKKMVVEQFERDMAPNYNA